MGSYFPKVGHPENPNRTKSIKNKHYTIIDFNFGRHSDLLTRKSDIYRGRKTEVNITFEG